MEGDIGDIVAGGEPVDSVRFNDGVEIGVEIDESDAFFHGAGNAVDPAEGRTDCNDGMAGVAIGKGDETIEGVISLGLGKVVGD